MGLIGMPNRMEHCLLGGSTSPNTPDLGSHFPAGISQGTRHNSRLPYKSHPRIVPYRCGQELSGQAPA